MIQYRKMFILYIMNNNSKSSNFVYECKSCEYTTTRKSNFEKHLLSKKHLSGGFGSSKMTECVCGKKFKHLSSLSRHKQRCKGPQEKKVEVPTIEPSVVMELVKSNMEFKSIITNLLDNVSNGTLANNSYNSHNTNNSNNRFNINIFLNEHCKDAMNIEEFVESIDFTLDDLEETGKHGYVKGISRIITNKLNSMDLFTRPLHCTDAKRETLYIKEENNWKKDDEQHSMFRNVIAEVSAKNEGLIEKWKENHPLCNIAGTKETDQIMDIYYNSMTGSNEEHERFSKKIIKNVLKEVIITKDIGA